MAGHRGVGEIEAEIAAVERRIFAVKDEIAQWNDVAAGLSASAAIERARNGEMGRGLGGLLLGSKYRAAARRAAASGNAAIAREVATKRSEIARAKENLRSLGRELAAELRDLKAELKATRTRARERARASSPEPPSTPPPVDVKQELKRLKLLHQQGQLDAGAYESARIRLLQPFLRS